MISAWKTEEMFDMKMSYNKFMNKWTQYNQ